ncbi:MAG: methylenetetrahydrofolate reductase [NAD(P)H] [Candidatus Eremiobacteraeota bacterium]|nr:methylenetetrahydrofolate reductase [NAD(P)H] [Candidatus Eremiobacteraeota bacterium]
MKLDLAFSGPDPSFSFEFFPPGTDESAATLLETIETLRVFGPTYVSVTYGAGGSTRARTVDVAKRIKNDLGLEVVAHVTCVGHTTDELRAVFGELESAGIENVLALRGDPPRGQQAFAVTEGGFRYATELIAMLSAEFPFAIGAAAYPEKHPEAVTFEDDLENAARKVQAGATFLVTQLFFDNDAYFRFVERARAIGIGVPIVPGIMPITNYGQIARIAKMCGASMPERLHFELEARADQPEAVAELGVSYCTLQCADLLARGAPGIHFYTLNRSPATRAVLSALLAARNMWQPSASRRASSPVTIA